MTENKVNAFFYMRINTDMPVYENIVYSPNN